MIKNIRAKSFKSVFSLTHSNEIEIKEILRGMNVRKKCQLKDIPTKIMEINGNIFASFIRLHFNYCIDNRGFFIYKINNGRQSNLEYGVPRSILFNIHLNDLFSNITNYAHDATPYVCYNSYYGPYYRNYNHQFLDCSSDLKTTTRKPTQESLIFC